MAKTPKLVSLPAAEALVKPLDEDNAAELHTASTPTDAELDDEEKEFRALRRDLPGVKGASAAGIVAISVGKAPTKNEFFRTHRDFGRSCRSSIIEVGMERQYLRGHRRHGRAAGRHRHHGHRSHALPHDHAARRVPHRSGAPAPTVDGEQNEYDRTKEIGLIQGIDEWVRLYTDQENRCYKVFPAPAGRFADPQWPELKHGKIFRLAFRDKGRLIDSIEHPLFKKWAARDSD